MTKKKIDKKTALYQITALYKQAQQNKANISLASDYIRKARNIAKKFRIRLTPLQKRKFCKHCYTYFVQGENVRVRYQPGHVVYTCLACNKQSRFPTTKRTAKV